MNRLPSPTIPLLAATLLFAAAWAPPAEALRVTAQAAAACQGALPAFETAIRKRPLAVQNEGDAPAFVTCALTNPGTSNGVTRIQSGQVYVQNLGSVTRSVSCTAVNSSASAAPAPAAYLTRTLQVPPSTTASTAFSFAAADFAGAPILLPGDTFGVSCSLPPGVGITGTVLNNNNF